MKTKLEIESEIEALEGCKKYIPHRSAFGDDNHANLDLQIEALRGEIDQTADEWNDFSCEEKSVILEALDWMEGLAKFAPSVGWDNYKPEVQP